MFLPSKVATQPTYEQFPCILLSHFSLYALLYNFCRNELIGTLYLLVGRAGSRFGCRSETFSKDGTP
jgi:hypothetical protein